MSDNTAKKPARKPDPMTRIINDVKTAIKDLGEYEAKPVNDARRSGHDRRAEAWAKEWARTSTQDSLVLATAFEALACYPHEQRDALISLAAIALNEVVKLDGAK
ncbi:hypothetical protein ACFYWP_01845 [Actinacidiphila glaucinigra]|uniref:hypothetical protein n=1 Tax=Actinacidiphila glaucinigra TaxID=235986 RepID=UPI0036AA59E4